MEMNWDLKPWEEAEIMTEIRTYMDSGINWNWYLQGRFDDEAMTVEIIFHDRWHKYDDAVHPVVENPRVRFNIVEGDMCCTSMEEDGTCRDHLGAKQRRIARKVQVGELTYTVTNPANVFSYRG